jgi:hypothetical protein
MQANTASTNAVRRILFMRSPEKTQCFLVLVCFLVQLLVCSFVASLQGGKARLP